MSRLAGNRVAVTGGAGFLGRRVVRLLEDRGSQVFVPRRARYDLTRMEDAARMFADAAPRVVVHLAGRVGGLGCVRDRPAEFFYENLMMGATVLEQARAHGVEKLVFVSSVCAYPRDAPVPLREDDLWRGYPEQAKAPYGLAKRAVMALGQLYRLQYGLNFVCLVPANLYGPGDNFDPVSAHVVPALIAKCLQAAEEGRQEVEVWGSGSASREFLYVDDCAEAVVLATERYEGAEPVNVGSGREVSISELAETVARLAGFWGRIRWDRSKPQGPARSLLDPTRAKERLGFRARTSLEDGLRRTVEWYREQGSYPARVQPQGVAGAGR